jgi:phage terminase large subunit
MLADFPDKLQCLFEPARYKVLYGGRGGAKSWGAARALLILGAQRKLRIACGREIMKSIADSVHHLLKEQIAELGLSHHYRAFDTYIEGKNGTLFTFHGLKTNIASVKSIEGIDIFWAEEAQTIGKTSWDVLIPTIRKEGSEIWITFNPELDTDETYKRFVLQPPATAMVVKINYRDNPWFPNVLEQERVDCLAKSEDDHSHIWEGNTKQVLDGAIYADEIRRAIKDGRFARVPYDESKPVETYWDLGRADCTSIWFAQYVGFEFRLIDFYENRGKGLPHYLKVLRDRPYLYGDVWLPHDAENELLGSERTIERQVRDANFTVKIAPKTSIAEGINAARTIFSRCWFDETKCSEGINHLKRYCYKVDPDTKQWSKDPNHDDHSHAADAFRYLAMSMQGPRNVGGDLKKRYSGKGIV